MLYTYLVSTFTCSIYEDVNRENDFFNSIDPGQYVHPHSLISIYYSDRLGGVDLKRLRLRCDKSRIRSPSHAKKDGNNGYLP